ncbi:MAG TPA: hypothetical protein VKR43_14145 [Bryobacteraceae bacterium]|nr:hypothetical protein [Bryobacteraceae bacterium]
MTFDHFEKATTRELRAEARDCFEKAARATTFESGLAYLFETQFYMQELDRRHGGRIAWRDLILEIVVIVLIGTEIGLAIKQGKDEDELMGKQNAILSNLQTSTADTATAMKGLVEMTKAMRENTSASASTLVSLQKTTETMSRGVQDQLALNYDLQVNVIYDATGKNVHIINAGRTNVSLWGDHFGNETISIQPEGRIIPPGGVWTVSSKTYADYIKNPPKNGSVTLPLILYLKNEHSEEFVLESKLTFEWKDDVLSMRTQVNTVRPEHWSRTLIKR